MIIRLLLCGFCFSICSSYADEVIWKGKVDSSGIPTKLIDLKIHDQYQIKVSQYINLGKWVQASERLANDACYQFDEKAKLSPHKYESIKNSHNISVCDGKYHDDHVYLSEPFIAKQNRIFFWIYDIDYDDNSGALDLEIIHKSK
ncbi:MAG TPA: hypothetical protein VIH61_10530 [Waddliaceae bacterium]